MSDESNRREFLRLLGVGTGAAASGLLAACSSTPETTPDVAGADGGRDATDSGGADGGMDTAAEAGGDTAVAPDGTGDGGGDTSADASEGGDGPDGGDGGEDAGSCEATGSDVEGPFHAEGSPTRTRLAKEDEPGERMMVQGTVYGPDCRTPLSEALLDVWHANAEGDYYDAANTYKLRGQMRTDDHGRYGFDTIKPGRYPLSGSQRPAHVHFMVSAPGYQPLTTQMYFAGDPFLPPDDPCGGCNSEDPTLVVDFQTQKIDGSSVLVGTFDIVLQKS